MEEIKLKWFNKDKPTQTNRHIIDEITYDMEKYDMFSVTLRDGMSFGVADKFRDKLNVGDEIILYTKGFSTIVGVDLILDEVPERLWLKTDDELDQGRLKWLIQNEKQKQEKFKKEKKSLDKKYEALPKEFKDRIDRFRNEDKRFRIDSEGYEMFCCQEAVKIAKAIKTSDKIKDFADLEWKKQLKLVPKLSDGHSGNTFGGSCNLAYNYLKGVAL